MTWLILAITIWLCNVGVAQSRIPAKELPISITVTPTQCFEPCSIRADLVIPQQESNRWAIIEVDGPMFRSSSIQLEGLKAAKRYSLQYEGFLTGEYDVKGILYNTSREISRQTKRLLVIGDLP